MLSKIDLKYATRLINHGPVVLVSAFSPEGVLDVTPVAWCMPLSKDPPRVVLEIGKNHYIRECIDHSGDFAVNILSAEHLEDIVYCGSVSGREENKLENCRLTAGKSESITSSSLSQAIGVLECRAVHPELASGYNLVAGEVVNASADDEIFSEHWEFYEDGQRTVHHLGGRKFCVPEAGFIR